MYHPSNSNDCINPCQKYIRIKVYDLGVPIVEVTNCTMPLCITSWYSVGVYSPKHKNRHLIAFEYHDVRMHYVTIIAKYTVYM